MPSVQAISDQTGFLEGKLTYRRLIAARTEGSRATLSVPRSSVVAAHLLHELERRGTAEGTRAGVSSSCRVKTWATNYPDGRSETAFSPLSLSPISLRIAT